jgi:hypothetical protein
MSRRSSPKSIGCGALGASGETKGGRFGAPHLYGLIWKGECREHPTPVAIPGESTGRPLCSHATP